ncbi:MAG: DNA alkylation repair protein [Magnetococcus sp. MYC-9]
MKSTQVMAELDAMGSTERAAGMSRFFKTGPGQYGEGDRFIGVRVPDQRIVARRFSSLSLKEIGRLLESLVHEHRLTGLLILVEQFSRSESATSQLEIVDFYLTHLERVNNWDLVDLSAPKILGEHLLRCPDKRSVLFSMAQSANLWDRRIAVVATWPLIKQWQFEELMILSKMLLTDSHDLMHKAVGWMLREAGKVHLVVLEEFLEMYAGVMPRTMLRYAIERLASDRRRYFMERSGFHGKDTGRDSLGGGQHG